jgi:cell division septum initiation protein DivIVA
MSHGEFLSLVKASCPPAVVERAQELIEENDELKEQLFEQDDYVASLQNQIDDLNTQRWKGIEFDD